MIPTSGKAEIHIGYECDLACRNCNRMSFLNDAHTPAMVPADLTDFLDQCRALGWWPSILLIGGEPTMHPDFFEFCAIAQGFVTEGRQIDGNELHCQLWSNQASEDARAKCAKARDWFGVSLVPETVKPRSQILSIYDIFVSPIDMGLDGRPHCWQHASEICGISVDSAGFTPCAIGGAIDGILGLGFRTKRLADLFDEEKVAEITKTMCGHCGHHLSQFGHPKMSAEDWRAKVAAQPKWNGMRVSPTWEAAFAGRR